MLKQHVYGNIEHLVDHWNLKVRMTRTFPFTASRCRQTSITDTYSNIQCVVSVCYYVQIVFFSFWCSLHACDNSIVNAALVSRSVFSVASFLNIGALFFSNLFITCLFLFFHIIFLLVSVHMGFEPASENK